ncbi:MAG: hypothetical protein AABY22_01675 [Nanoarchaeota archaeon]
MNKQIQKIIEENLDEILEVIKSKLPRYEPEPDFVIMRELKEYLK